MSNSLERLKSTRRQIILNMAHGTTTKYYIPPVIHWKNRRKIRNNSVRWACTNNFSFILFRGFHSCFFFFLSLLSFLPFVAFAVHRYCHTNPFYDYRQNVPDIQIFYANAMDNILLGSISNSIYFPYELLSIQGTHIHTPPMNEYMSIALLVLIMMIFHTIFFNGLIICCWFILFFGFDTQHWLNNGNQ